uniref:Reverse transcriptase domain-containing protein n=1 Tax=Tanacetum cinerariifolium TaxID=118510 RepID=A0A6L2MZZ6_TANCI|nr:reverse transcriptase domain-containing protein [Tanacetum cinerariifolium]
MRTRSSSNLSGKSPPNPSSSNPKRHNRRRSKQPFILEESPVDTMAYQRNMAELLRTPTEGYAEAIMGQPVGGSKKNPCILFSLRRILFPNSLMNSFPPSRTTNLRNEITNFQQRFDESFHEAWDRYKDLLHACPHHGFTEFHQLDTFYNALNPADQNSLNSAAASVKAVEEICVTCGGAHPYYQCLAADGNTFSELRDNIQGYVTTAAVNYNQGSGPLHSNTIANSKMHKQKQQEKDEVQIHKFWQMFKQLHINITLADALILIPKYQKMLKALLSNKEKLLEMANTPLNKNCSAVILKKLPKKLRDPKKFLILCGFSELKCKALANLGASINLMPLSVWKKLGLPELISTRMTLELANQAICTPAGIARDVFVSVGKFTFLADFVIDDYESDPRVPLILGRPFLRTTRALIDVHREEMILCDNDERLTLNMIHDTSSYSNQPQKVSINMINIFNDSSEDFLEKLFATNHQSVNPTFSSHPELTSPKVKDVSLIRREAITTSSSSPNHLLEEFADELALITFPPGNDDLPFDIGSDLKEIEFLLNNDPIKEMNSILKDSIDEDNLADLNDNLADTIPDMFTDEHALDYPSPLLYDEYDNDLFEVEFDTKYVYDDPFDSKGEKIKESKLLIDELDLPRSSDFLPSPEYDSFLFEDFSKVDALPSTDNEDTLFNPGILIQENLSEVNTRVAPDKNVKKIAISHASLILEDFDPPLYELPFLKEVPSFKTLLSFHSKMRKKFSNPGF